MRDFTSLEPAGTGNVRLFLCGDVMLGRGIDQILPHPSRPELFEQVVRDARDYVALAELVHGPIPSPVPFDYVWGDALAQFARFHPDLRLINLETSVTTRDEHWAGKGIHYRMHPANVACLAAAGIDCCVLANNHVLDWGLEGLRETLAVLHGAGVASPGAGEDLDEAQRVAVLPLSGGGRVLVLALGHASSGIPAQWRAGKDRPGVELLANLDLASAERLADRVRALEQPGDIVIASIHWGSNWGYEVPKLQQEFAHALVERAGVDIVHGHSSHHPRPIEVYRDRLILYGCGDFLNDYEGIGGYEVFRPDLSLMYFPRLDAADGKLLSLTMVPMQIRRFSLHQPPAADVEWIGKVLGRQCAPFGTLIADEPNGMLALRTG